MAATPVGRRPFGQTGLTVSSLGMGCAKLGAFWQGRSTADGRRALEEARRCGINLFDTADCYARGISERVIGRAIRHGRDDVVISTKVGLLKTPVALVSAARRSPDLRPRRVAQLRAMAPGAKGSQCFADGYVEKAVERSLRRLSTDRVELLLLHDPPLEQIRAQTFLPAVERLRQAGKVLHFGVSCATEGQALAALELPALACLQVPYNLSREDLVGAVRGQSERRGVAIMAMAPFGDGTLLKAAQDQGHPLDVVARACLHFALSAAGVSSVVAGMSTAEHVRANVAAAAAAPPPPGVVESIRSCMAPPAAGC